ncbi:MAG: hypothetical protein ABEJ86_04960, partial [Halococcoides sp.]
MPHTCEDCDEAFDTLSGLRLHECSEEESTAVEDIFEDRRKEISKQEREPPRGQVVRETSSLVIT